MLDVHPPHHPTHTWKDFFIHIATITVGLLIAFGIEQIVERIHTGIEVREAREAIAREQENNRALFRHDEQIWLRTFATLRADVLTLEYIRSHPHATQSDLPTELDWIQFPFLAEHAEWDAAVAKGVIGHMPQAEANQLQYYYNGMQIIDKQSLAAWDAVNDAVRYNFTDADPQHLSPAEVDREIDLARIALARHFEQGYTLARMTEMYRDLPQLITYESLKKLRPAAYDRDRAAMQGPHDRLAAILKDNPIPPLPAR